MTCSVSELTDSFSVLLETFICIELLIKIRTYCLICKFNLRMYIEAFHTPLLLSFFFTGEYNGILAVFMNSSLDSQLDCFQIIFAVYITIRIDKSI